MLVANTLAGLLMFLLHKSAKQMPKEEYGLCTVLFTRAAPSTGGRAKSNFPSVRLSRWERGAIL
jgi:hypothetical protein